MLLAAPQGWHSNLVAGGSSCGFMLGRRKEVLCGSHPIGVFEAFVARSSRHGDDAQDIDHHA